MMLPIAFASIVLGLALVAIAVYKICAGEFSAYWASLLGIGGLAILDVGKYYFVDAGRVGWMGDWWYVMTSCAVWTSFLIFVVSYRYFERSAGSASGSRPYTIHWRRHGKVVWKWTKVACIPLAVVSAALVRNDAELGEFESSYATIVLAGLLKGVAATLILAGLVLKDRSAVIVGVIAIAIGVTDVSRRAYIALFLPILIALVTIYYDRARSRGASISKGIKWSVFGLLAVLFIFLNALRSDHDFGDGFNADDRIANTLTYILTLRSVDTFDNTRFILENTPDEWDYFWGETYAAVLVAPIPRAWWPEKPVSLASQLGMIRSTGITRFDGDAWRDVNRFSLSPGFSGEAFANFGFFGLILLPVAWAFIACRFDVRRICADVNPQTIPFIFFITTFVLLSRGDFYVSINYQIFIFLASYVMMRLTFVRTYGMGQ